MPEFYKEECIKLNQPGKSGHDYDRHAIYDEKITLFDESKEIVYKKNKRNDPYFTRLEIAFTHVAALFQAKNSTPLPTLVMKEVKEKGIVRRAIAGLAVEKICYTIARKEILPARFYRLKKPFNKCYYELQSSDNTDRTVDTAENIPYYFFNELPQEFFARLQDAARKGRLQIDYASLAAILTSSYTLEEDDFHKGHFGFYLVEREKDLPRVVFFKIDHGLSLVDSIMSFYSSRKFHWNDGDHAFDITAEDLLNFPVIKSANTYWPTKKSPLPYLSGDKKYHSDREIQSFAGLATNPEFIKAKWMNFYKQILLPKELIQQSLVNMDVDNPDRAQIRLLTQSILARQATLRAVLFSLEPFRNFVCGLSAKDKQDLLEDMQFTPATKAHEAQVHRKMADYHALCVSSPGFCTGDTPLHVAIKLGEYRYEESFQHFGRYLNENNNLGMSPLDVAIECAQQRLAPPASLGADPYATIKDLLAHGAEKTDLFLRTQNPREIARHIGYHPCREAVAAAVNYQQLKDVLVSIGVDHSLCLKTQKKLAIDCITQFIKQNKNKPNQHAELQQLRREISGYRKDDTVDVECLQYVRQLQSKLWIVRQIRGLFGQTSTLSTIQTIIDKELSRLKPCSFLGFSFFADTKESPLPDARAPGLRSPT